MAGESVLENLEPVVEEIRTPNIKLSFWTPDTRLVYMKVCRQKKKPLKSGCKVLILNEPCRARTCDPLIKSHVSVCCENFVSIATTDICYTLQPLAIARTSADLR
jgi:hypothetical protein